MSEQIDSILRDAFVHVGSVQKPITLEELSQRVPALREIPQTSRPMLKANQSGRRPRSLVLVAAGVTVLVAAVAVALTGTTSPGPPIVNPVSTTPVAEATTVATVVGTAEREFAPDVVDAALLAPLETSVGRVEWTTLDGDGAGIPSIYADIDGYVISGLDDKLLFSSDGIAWSDGPSSTGLDGYRAFRSSGDWAVAGQSMWKGSGASRDLLQSNGRTWVRVEIEDPWPELPHTLPQPDVNFSFPDNLEGNEGEQIVRADFGYLAVQNTHDDDGEHTVHFWISADGNEWEYIVSVDSFPFGMGHSAGAVGDLIYLGGTGGNRGTILIGHIGSPDLP